LRLKVADHVFGLGRVRVEESLRVGSRRGVIEFLALQAEVKVLDVEAQAEIESKT